MNNFIKASLKERAYLQELFKNEVFVATDEKSSIRHDGILDTKKGSYIIECKIRDIKSTDYKDTLIEKSKVDYLIERGKEMKRIPLLIIFFDKDNKYAFFPLTEYSLPKPTKKNMARTTAEKSEKIEKEIYLLKITNTYNRI